MRLYGLRPRRVLEVGAANGVRLAAIAEACGADVVALEPSKAAIADGRARFPGVEFVRGSAHAIPLDEPFDLVIVNFVFHWIDRRSLLRSVAEVDRLLAEGGFLILGDFLPSNLVKVPYHHLPGGDVHTYKQSYAATFVGSGLYHAVCLLTDAHAPRQDRAASSLTADAPEHERIGAWLLRKALDEHYVEVELPAGLSRGSSDAP